MLRRDVKAPRHGGRLAQARAEQPNLDWLDLSTGLNPQSYPQPNLDPSVFQRLPEPDSELNRLLSSVCKGHACAPTSGTQAVIEHLPLLFESMTVGVQPSVTPSMPTVGKSTGIGSSAPSLRTCHMTAKSRWW